MRWLLLLLLLRGAAALAELVAAEIAVGPGPLPVLSLQHNQSVSATANTAIRVGVRVKGVEDLGKMFAAVMLQWLPISTEETSKTTEEDARLSLRPSDAPRSMMVPLVPSDDRGVLLASCMSEDLANVLMLTAAQTMVSVEVLLSGGIRHKVGIVNLQEVTPPTSHLDRTVIVMGDNARFTVVSRREAFWRTPVSIKHRLPPVPSSAATAKSIVFSGAALALPPLVLLYGVTAAGVARELLWKFDRPFFCINGVVWLMATLLILYWTVLDFLSFVWLCGWMLPLVIFVEQHGIRSYVMAGRLILVPLTK